MLDVGPDPPRARGNFGVGMGRPIIKYRDNGPLMGRGNFAGFHPIEKHCDCLLWSLAISVLHFGPRSASFLISLKAIAGHIGPTIEV